MLICLCVRCLHTNVYYWGLVQFIVFDWNKHIYFTTWFSGTPQICTTLVYSCKDTGCFHKVWVGRKGIDLDKIRIAINKAFLSFHWRLSCLFLCWFLLRVYISIFISVMAVPLNKEEIKCGKTSVSHFPIISLNTREPDLHYLGAR